MKKLLLIVLLFTTIVHAQQSTTLTEAEKRSIIDSIADKLQWYYVFPNSAKTF